MTWLIVEPSKPEGEIEAQPSKSYTHRAASVGLLAEGESSIIHPLHSLDTQATLDAARILGAKVSENERTWGIVGTGGELSPQKNKIDVKNSGTTLRFMSAIAALSPKKVQLSGDESIQKRPMGPLIDALKELGADAECKGSKGRPPVIVGGGIDGGEVSITGEVSSQFISALLLACPYSTSGVDLMIEGELKSKPYIQMTLKTLASTQARIKTDSTLTEFNIPGEQKFKSINFDVPGDFSSAAFLLGAGALTGSSVKINNLDPQDVQGDKKIIELIEEFGVGVKTRKNSVKVTGEGELEGIEADCSDTPDLVPILAVLGSAADGQTKLTNIPHLRYKEVDRLKALSKELEKTGAEIKEKKDELQIEGVTQLKGGKFDSYGDHRIAMALAVAGLAARGGAAIKNAECVNVSYPNFIQDMRELGIQLKMQEHGPGRK